jgi:hypothetical protein
MSDYPEGAGWWQASDGKWYPPEQFSGSPPVQPLPQQPTQSYGYGVGQPGAPRNEPLAVASLATGIAGLVLICCFIGFLGAVAAIVTGLMARKRISESNGTLTGEGLATAGIVLGVVGIVLGLALGGLWILGAFAG